MINKMSMLLLIELKINQFYKVFTDCSVFGPPSNEPKIRHLTKNELFFFQLESSRFSDFRLFYSKITEKLYLACNKC